MAAPPRKSQLFSTCVIKETHFHNFGTKVATLQYKCSKEIHFGSSSSMVATCQYKCNRQSTLWQANVQTLGLPLGATRMPRNRRQQMEEQPRSSFCSGRARVPRKGTSKGKRSHARNPARAERGCHAKASDPLAEAIQLAHARPSCTSLGRVSQTGCNRASPAVFAVSCNGSPTVLIIEFGFGIHKQRAPKSLATPPLKAWQL